MLASLTDTELKSHRDSQVLQTMAEANLSENDQGLFDTQCIVLGAQRQ